LEELDCRIELSPAQVDRTLSTLGIGFLFARLYHPVLKAVAPIRQRLQVRTIFNSVGPLLNPCRVRRQLMGISQPFLAPVFMEVFKSLGHEHVGIVHGEDGLDEVTLTGSTSLLELRKGETVAGELTPDKYGFLRVPFKALEGGDRVENARIFLSILEGTLDGPLHDLVCFNAGLGFFLADHAASIEEGISLSREILDSKKAYALFLSYRDLTHRL
jgi:anthranilate phosphoribosyltransferase